MQRGAGGGLAVIRALLAGSWAKCIKQDQGSTIDANFRMLNDCFKYCMSCSNSHPLNPLFWSYVGISFHPSSVGHLSVCSSQQVVVMPHMVVSTLMYTNEESTRLIEMPSHWLYIRLNPIYPTRKWGKLNFISPLLWWNYAIFKSSKGNQSLILHVLHLHLRLHSMHNFRLSGTIGHFF